MRKSLIILSVLIPCLSALLTGCTNQNQSPSAAPSYQWQTVFSDNFAVNRAADTWVSLLSEKWSGPGYRRPVLWSWSDTSGGKLTFGDTMAAVTGRVTGTCPLKSPFANTLAMSMTFRLSSVDSNAAAVMLIDSTKRKKYRFGINMDGAGAIAPGILTISCFSADSNKMISETHQTVQGLTINTDYQLVLTLSPSSLTGELDRSGSLVSRVALDSSVIIAFSGPVTSVLFRAGIDLAGTPPTPVFPETIAAQASYPAQSSATWLWNDTSILRPDSTGIGIRCTGNALGSPMQVGGRVTSTAGPTLQVSMDFRFSSLTADAAAVTVVDSATNRRYWLIAGNNGIGQTAAGQLSVVITEAGNSQVIVSQSHQTIPGLSANTLYLLIFTLDNSKILGELQQSVSTVAQTQIQPSPLSATSGEALTFGVNLVGTAAAPVFASGFMVEVRQVISTGGGGSCPFVYSFNGSGWAFDAEPYGGAFSRGLARTEWCVLEHLAEANGRYALRMTNELDETQYTDELKLVVVDHDPGVAVAPDASGAIHTIENPVSPRSARDAAGTDILPLVQRKDGRLWQSSLLRSIPAKAAAERDTLEFEFPKPAAAKTVKLLINACTTPFGADMGKRFLAMHGSLLSRWYDEIDKGGAACDRVRSWYKDEELYLLKAWVRTPHGWEARETILGSGPMAAKAKVYLINTSDIPGTALRIRLCPPAGFWSFDYLAADYSTDRKISVTEVGAASAQENNGKDDREALRAQDGSYLVSEKGSSVDLSFAAPERPRATARTVVLKATGWYRMHLDARGMPRLDLLARMNEPGFGAKYAVQEYLRLYRQTAMR